MPETPLTDRATWPDFSAMKSRLQRAMDRLKDHDKYLLQHGHEQAITHRLAMYLQDEFPTWHVDVEFNRNLGERKRLSYARDGEPEAHQHDIRPDIIVHRRGTVQHLLIVEAKKHRENCVDAEAKLRAATVPTDSLHYEFGILVVLPAPDADERLRWFQGGQLVENTTRAQ